MDALIRTYDGAGGRLSFTERRSAPWILLDAFQVLDQLAEMYRWEQRKNLEATQRRR